MIDDAPAVAVIFISTRADGDDEAYQQVAAVMDAMARRQPGFLRMESVRDPHTRRGITVSVWTDEQSARAWKDVAEHQAAQQDGRDRFYQDYEVMVTKVVRGYRFSR
jgi:heme-degrading monooxygenase HmoA